MELGAAGCVFEFTYFLALAILQYSQSSTVVPDGFSRFERVASCFFMDFVGVDAHRLTGFDGRIFGKGKSGALGTSGCNIYIIAC